MIYYGDYLILHASIYYKLKLKNYYQLIFKPSSAFDVNIIH